MSDTQLSQAERQAIWWQARLSSDLLSAEQRREFDAWLTQYPENAIAWRAINQFWTGLDSLTPADIGAEASGEASGKVLEFKPSKAAKPRQPIRGGLALAASLLLMLSVAYLQLDYYLADYRSATGQQQQITLADGSSIQLNTASAVSVDFSEQQRLITLHQGEAFFKVAADSTRPFIVKTDAGQVQALGTAFDVKRQDNEVTVTVFEHAVKVTTGDGQIRNNLAESEQLVFGSHHLNTVTRIDLQRAAAWHRQRMVFQDKPLADVAKELERYRPGKIIILSSSIKTLPITGVFDIADTNIALRTIEESLPVKVTKLSENMVLLTAK